MYAKAGTAGLSLICDPDRSSPRAPRQHAPPALRCAMFKDEAGQGAAGVRVAGSKRIAHRQVPRVGSQFVPAVRAADAIAPHHLRARRYRFAGVARCMGWIVLLLAAALARDAFAAGPTGSYAFRNYGADQGLRNQAVTSLAQDADGFLFVGTEDGLFRFDGSAFQRVGETDLPSQGVTLLRAGPHGILWVATEKGVVAWRGTARAPHVRGVLLPGRQVLGLGGSADGTLLASTTTGFFEGRDGRMAAVADVPAQAGASWRSADGHDAYFAVGERLYWRHDGHWRSRGMPAAAIDEAVQAIVRDPRGRIWLRGRQMLLRLATFDGDYENLTATLPGAAVQKGELVLDRSGRVWAPSNRGIACFDGDRRLLFDVAHGLPNEWATTVLVDREGSLWVGSEGVQQVQGRLAWSAFTRRQGLPSDTVWGVFRDRAGVLWAATNRGVAHADDRGHWTALPGTQQRSFYAFAESPQGELWIGGNSGHASHNTLLLRAPGTSTFVSVPLASADGPSTINSMAYGPDGALYIATIAHGLHRVVHGTRGYDFAQVALPGGTADEQVNQLARDGKGRLWAAGMRGLALFDGHRWRRLTTRDRLREDAIETLAAAGDDAMWISYWNVDGLSRVRVDAAGAIAVEQVSGPDALVGDTIYSSGPAAGGGLWLGTAMGVKRWRDGRVERFGRAEGLPGDDAAANGFWADADGDAWFGMANGLAHFSVHTDRGTPPPPTTFIQSVQDARARELKGSGEVAWRDRALTFHFAALGFLDTADLQREVRLLGFEDGWRQTSVSEARYTGLLPGRYRFQARARYGDGRYGNVATRSIVVLPPWWLTWWFIAIAVVSLVLLAMAAMRWRLARLRERNLALEALVDARTRDLQVANAALEEASMVDPLTGLKNRRYLSVFMPEELARCLRQRSLARASAGRGDDPGDRNIDLCLLMLDLDHFKQVNDTHGHGAGDAVLRQLGRLLLATCRDSDVVVRWGGEEFLILARNADRHQVQAMAALVCEAVRTHPFVLDDGTVLRRTCSLGFTAFPLLPGAPERFGWEQAVELADQCLYAAKSSGRDGWVGCLLQDDGNDVAVGQDIVGFGRGRILDSRGDADAVVWKATARAS
jgi:diguanylate cyclase (GGDEF)-like protein